MTYSIYKDDQKIEAWMNDDNHVNLEMSFVSDPSSLQVITLTDLEFLELFETLKREIDNQQPTLF